MKILQPLNFCRTPNGDLGIVPDKGLFASTAWTISDECFKSTQGTRFTWIAPDGNQYTEDRSIFTRPTEPQIIEGLKSNKKLLEIAVKMRLIEL